MSINILLPVKALPDAIRYFISICLEASRSQIVPSLLMNLGKKAFSASIPILFGYIPLGAAFGILFSTLGLPWYFAALSGLIVYAGAAQFLSISLLASHLNLVEIFLAIFTLNIRHIFYGFSFLKRYKGGAFKPYLIFGLTDETYSLLTSNVLSEKEKDQRFCFFVTALNQFYWVLGCALGGVFGALLTINTKGFEFVLTALFVVLTLEQWFTVKKCFPFMLGAAVSLISFVLFKSQFLLSAICMATAVLLLLSLKGKTDA